MGVVKLVGVAFKVTGEVLTADGFEAWLTSVTTEKLGEVVGHEVRGPLGKARARREARRGASLATSSETFQVALDAHLNNLDGLVRNISNACSKVPLLTIDTKHYASKLVVVPRHPLRVLFEEYLVSGLVESAELARYTGLGEIVLRNLAADAERDLSEVTSRNAPISYGYIIVRVDALYKWPAWTTPGHYYVVTYLADQPDIRKKRERNKFTADISEPLQRIQSRLGQIDETVQADVVEAVEQQLLKF
jgi:hypothetical protein